MPGMRDRDTFLKPIPALAIGIAGVLAVTLVLVPFGEDLTRVAPALLLVLPVVVAGILGGRIVAAAVAVVAAFAFATGFLPPIGSPAVEVGDDFVALILFVIVAGATGVIVATLVATERRRLAAEHAEVEALQHVDTQRAGLLRSVSHDLRTPLATIHAAATDLDSDVQHPTHVEHELLSLVLAETERLDRLVANLLSMSRVEAGAFLPDRAAVDLRELVEACLVRLARLLHRVRVETSIAEDLPLVELDYTQIDQVLSNLLENAARHSPDGGAIRIACRTAAGDAVEIEVSDDGEGVPVEQRESIFEPFSGSHESGSTGIGLAICRSVALAHGGTIMVSDSPSGGARFVLRLPIHV
jgi:K+-sensing histidine kinase KdpD